MGEYNFVWQYFAYPGLSQGADSPAASTASGIVLFISIFRNTKFINVITTTNSRRQCTNGQCQCVRVLEFVDRGDRGRATANTDLYAHSIAGRRFPSPEHTTR